MKNLKELREYLNSIPNINRGGCLISAYSMFLYLKKTNQLPEGFKILQISDNVVQRFLLMRQLESKDPTKYTGGCQHAMCRVGGIIFDSGESRPIDIDPIAFASSVPVDPETQSEYIIAQINTDGWNDEFNREKYVPAIAEELGIDLSNIRLDFDYASKKEAQKIVGDEEERLQNAAREYRKATGKRIVGSPENELERALLAALG